QDVVSKGWELQFTTNITRNWRASVSYSHFATELANIAPTSGRLIAQYRDKWMATPNALIGTGSGARTVAVVDNLVYNSYLITKAQEGARTMNERQNKFTFVTNYDFTEGLLKGFGVGANAIWEDKASTGYALKQVAGSWVPDPAHPFFTGSLLRLGASVGYNHKLFHDKINWRLQLNVYNIGGINPYVVRASAASTAPTIMIPTYMNRGTPQGWSLTSTFNF
ncbi:MAG: TonB-dependent receptor, partial [Lacunisphaera sp.]|nr:TonB-dependent receptor [Lacunisphaera sp.]